MVKPHHFKKGKATEFRVNLCWPGLKDRVTTGRPALAADDMTWEDWDKQSELDVDDD